MSDLSRLRRLAGLTETIADDPHTNAEIERRLDALPAATRTMVLDALDVLKSAGPAGLLIKDWAAGIRAVNSDPELPLKDVLVSTVRTFSNVVHKIGDRRYAWIVSGSADDDDTPPALRQALSQQVAQTDAALRVMFALPEFTRLSLAIALGAELHLPGPSATTLADHLMTHFSGQMQAIGAPGAEVYRMRQEPPPTRDDTMRMLRNLGNPPS